MTLRRNKSLATQVMLLVECDTCGALAGDWCLTKGAKRSQYLHAVRRTVEVSDILWRAYLDSLESTVLALDGIRNPSAYSQSRYRGNTLAHLDADLASYNADIAWMANNPWGER